MKKIVFILSKQSVFPYSGVWRHILWLYDAIKDDFDIQLIYQPEDSGYFWRVFTLPRILKKLPNDTLKIFCDENFLVSLRTSYTSSSIFFVMHYPFIVPATSLKENIIRYISFFTFKKLKTLPQILTISYETQKMLTSIFSLDESKIKVLPCTFDTTEFFPVNLYEKTELRRILSKQYSISKDKKWILYVGTNESRKNLMTLISALVDIPDILFIRIGSSVSDKNEQELTVAMTKNSINTVHIEWITNQQMIEWYQSADVFVFPSLYEGFGRPPIEAQCCGCPVISTHGWALEEVIGSSAYIVSDPMDVSAFHQAIVAVLSDSRLRESLQASGLSNVKRFDPRGVMLQFHQLVSDFVLPL